MNRIIHEEANREFRAALDYYLELSPDLGVSFYREMERLMNEVCEHPHAFRVFDPPARRHFTTRFPYGIIYLVLPDTIWILAVMHLHRAPGYWRQRLS